MGSIQLLWHCLNVMKQDPGNLEIPWSLARNSIRRLYFTHWLVCEVFLDKKPHKHTHTPVKGLWSLCLNPNRANHTQSSPKQRGRDYVMKTLSQKPGG